MDTNPISSLLENLKQKFTNPFLGTFILVWIVHNWRLVFSFFNFDERTNLERKMKVISIYYDSAFSVGNLALCAGIALGVLIASFIGINLSRIIVEYSEKVVKPIILKISGSAKVVERIDLIAVEDELNVWVKKHDSELTAKNAIQKQYDEIVEKNNTELGVANDLQGTELEPTTDQKINNEYQEINAQLIEKNLNDETKLNILAILRGKRIEGSEWLDLMLYNGILEISDTVQGSSIYRFTQKGEGFREFIAKYSLRMS